MEEPGAQANSRGLVGNELHPRVLLIPGHPRILPKSRRYNFALQKSSSVGGYLLAKASAFPKTKYGLEVVRRITSF